MEKIDYWYVLFEGKLIDENEFSHFYASVILPVNSNQTLNMALQSALADYNATLIAIEDSFEFVIEDYDENDKENQVWLDWYQEVNQTNIAKFTPWQRFNNP